MRALSPGYTSEVDTVDEQGWYQVLQDFSDANLHQTYAYGLVRCGRRNMSHLILKKGGDIVAAAQARIVKLPLINLGVASIGPGPLWRRGSSEPDLEVFRQIVRALHNEYVCKRGLAIRLYPNFFNDDAPCFSAVLAEEGFSRSLRGARKRTILMDLSPSLDDLYGGMRRKWRQRLKLANRRHLELIEGTNEDLFETFLGIYREMLLRKGFVTFVDINRYRQVQTRLPENFKMIIMLCRSAEGLCAGLICTTIGKSAIYLFGATSNVGMKSNGAYFLQWKLIKKLKQRGISTYDLNGIGPVRNPGTYRFKRGLSGANGRDVYVLGRFDSHSGFLSKACVNFGDCLTMIQRDFKGRVGSFGLERLRIEGAH